MSVEIGVVAPEFTLIDTDKKAVSLSQYKGQNVVLLFFPAAFTSTCTKELCQMRDELAYFTQLNAQILGISVDLPFTLARYKEDQNYNFPLLSDFNKAASSAYSSLYQEWIMGLKGVAKRSVFLIDKEGIIRHQEILENAGDYPDFDTLKKTLESL